MPANRRRMYTGYTDPLLTNYISAGFQVTNGRRIAPGRSGKDVPIVFVIDPRSAIPPEAVALQTAGKSAIIAQGGATDEPLIDVHTMELPGGLRAQFRLSELVTEAGAITFRPDLVIPSGESDAAVFKRALTFVRNHGSRPHAPPLPAIAMPVAENVYPEMRFPAREYRLLAAFRIWSVIRFFFPARDLMSEDWDSVVKQAIPRFEGARDALEYSFAVAELVHHLLDSHGFVTGPEIDEQFGAKPPVQLEIVEGLPVITAVRNADLQRESAIEVGDMVTAIDGDKAETRVAFWTKAVSASTPQFERFKVANLLLAGREGSIVDVALRKADRRIERVRLRRTERYQGLDAFAGGLFKGTQRTGPVFKILPGNIGYADLDRLDEANVPECSRYSEIQRRLSSTCAATRNIPPGALWAG